MFSRFDGAATPRTSGELIRRTNSAPDELIPTRLFDCFDRVIGAVGSCFPPHPESNPKRGISPAFITMFERLATNRLAGTNQRRGPLELVNREQS